MSHGTVFDLYAARRSILSSAAVSGALTPRDTLLEVFQGRSDYSGDLIKGRFVFSVYEAREDVRVSEFVGNRISRRQNGPVPLDRSVFTNSSAQTSIRTPFPLSNLHYLCCN
ncbi:hypothetical protein J6590_021116 [Homalodisca vitripennis]|nr:hypothetical protein J6590_021116 [Homalodisca vitripennis]